MRNLRKRIFHMLYQKFKPDKQLQPFVECYFTWNTEKLLEKELVVESPPNGFCSMVFNNGDPYYLHNKKYERLAVPKVFVAGQSIYSYQLFLKGSISISGIVFRPAGIASMFGLPMFQFTEERIDLGQVLPKLVVEELFEALGATPQSIGKAKLLEAFLMQYYHKNKPVPDFIDHAANSIVDKNGMINVNDMLSSVFMSRRNFERLFFKKVGISPKYYARIRRISYLMASIAGKKQVDWASLVSECEFYDQSHFIKDFVEFTGRTPKQYLEENQELVNLVERPREQRLT